MHHHAVRCCRFAAIAATVAAGACGRARISKHDAAAVIQSAAPYKTAKIAYVPRVISVPVEIIGGTAAAREGQALTLIQIASIDPVVAVLRARDQIEIEDFVSAVPSSIVIPKRDSTDSAKAAAKRDSTNKSDSTSKSDSSKTKPDSLKQDSTIRKPTPRLDQPMTSPPATLPFAQQWVHTLRVTPRARAEMADLTHDDGDYNEDAPRPMYNGRSLSRIPGWTLALGTREFMRVLAVSPRDPERSAGAVEGEIVVDFLWRWRPTRAGALFDAEGAEFQSLPTELQQAVQSNALTITTSTPQWSRATLARSSNGWRVTLVEWNYGDGKQHEPW